MPISLDTIVRGGQIVTPTGIFRSDIGIRAGQIALIGDYRLMPPAPEMIDANGTYVLPGLIDVHLHFSCYSHHVDPMGVALESAAHGGITTALTMLIPGVTTPRTPLQLIEEFRALGEKESIIDFNFHLHVAERPEALAEIRQAVDAGCPSFKVFMAYKSIGRMATDDHLMNTMERVAETGGMLLLHAEDGEIIDRRTAQQIAVGKISPTDFLYAHPPEVEYLAVEKALNMGRLTGCPLYILHISTPKAVEMIQEARSQGQQVWVETCPQYLELTDDMLSTFGPLAKVSPPLRTTYETRALWTQLKAGKIDVVSSDHSAHSAETKQNGYANIFDCWYGAPAVETMVPVMSDAARREGLSMIHLARWFAERPAKIFGLYPRKGAIQIGADADLAIWDPNKEVTIRKEDQHGNAGYTLYEGRKVLGWPVKTLLRGKVLLENGSLRQSPGYGRFVGRDPVVRGEGQ
jgi:dihydropyrimidinase